jgi:hypothetical protein
MVGVIYIIATDRTRASILISDSAATPIRSFIEPSFDLSAFRNCIAQPPFYERIMAERANWYIPQNIRPVKIPSSSVMRTSNRYRNRGWTGKNFRKVN